MQIIPTKIADLLIIDPQVFGDERGFFVETYQAARYADAGLPVFVQDNLSFSRRGVLRGLHLQDPHAQGKLVYVLQGTVLDVAVDVRAGSPTYGQWESVELSSDNKRQIYVPAGFAHGFCVLSETALFAYKCTDNYYPQHEQGIRWDDPDLQIDWGMTEPIVSEKDLKLPRWQEFTDQHGR